MAGCSDAGPASLAEARQSATEAIAADADYVYWAEFRGNLRRVPKGGGNATMVTSGPVGAVTSMVVDATTAYWTVVPYCSASASAGACALGALFSAPKTGGASIALDDSLTLPSSLTADDMNLYFLQSTLDASGYLVTRLSRAGGAPAVLGSKRSIISNLALDAESLYWAVADASGGGASIVKRSLTDGSETTLASGWIQWTQWLSAPFMLGKDYPQRLTLNASNVYWVAGAASQDQYAILTVPKHGGIVTPLVARSSRFTGAMIADSAYLYLADTDAFWKVPVGGGKCSQFALSFVYGGFIQDAGNIYFFDPRSAYIESTPKSP
jgi:hypothetical protein